MLVFFLTFYATRFFYFASSYRDGLTFFQSNVDNFPGLYNPYNNLGAEYGFKNMWGAAIDTWAEGLKRRSTDFKLNYNLGCALFNFNNLRKARDFLLKAKENMHESDLPWLKDLDEKLIICADKLGDRNGNI